MKIIGGYQDGNRQRRVLVLEKGDRPGKLIVVDAEITGDRGEEGIDLTIEEYGKDKPLDDPVARGENLPPPFWAREDEVNPYILHGEELARAEKARKEGRKY